MAANRSQEAWTAPTHGAVELGKAMAGDKAHKAALAMQWALVVMTIAPFIILALNAAPSTDDFCYGAWMREQGLGAAQLRAYEHQTGRYVATFLLMIQHTSRDLFGLHHFIVLGFIAAAVAGYWRLYNVLNHVGQGQVSLGDQAWLALATMAVTIAGSNTPNELLSWLPGVFSYQLGVILLTVGLASSLSLLFGRRQPIDRALLLAMAALSAGVNEIFAAIALAIVACSLGAAVVVKRERAFMAVSVLLAISAAALSIGAPGNFARIGWEGVSGRQDAVWALSTATGWSLLQGVRWLSGIGPAALALASLYLLGRGRLSSVIGDQLGPRSQVALGLVAIAAPFALTIAAVAPVVYALAGLPYSRIINTAFEVFLIAVVIAAPLVRPLIAADLERRWLRAAFVASAVGVALCLVGSPHFTAALGELKRLPTLRAELDARKTLLTTAQPGSDLVVPPLSREPQFVMHGDLPTDPKHWVNGCMSRYFGLHSLRRNGEPYPDEAAERPHVSAG